MASRVIHYRHLEGGELGVIKKKYPHPLNSVGFGGTLVLERSSRDMVLAECSSGDTVSHWALLYFIAERHFLHIGLRLTF